MKPEALKGELSSTSPHCCLPTPNRKRGNLDLQQEDYYFATPKEERRSSPCPATAPGWETTTTQLKETITTLNSLFPPMDFLSKQLLPTSSFFLQKVTFLSFARLAYGFAIARTSWMAILLLFPNKPILLVKYWLFYFKDQHNLEILLLGKCQQKRANVHQKTGTILIY